MHSGTHKTFQSPGMDPWEGLGCPDPPSNLNFDFKRSNVSNTKEKQRAAPLYNLPKN